MAGILVPVLLRQQQKPWQPWAFQGKAEIVCQDLFDARAHDNTFDSIVVSEVLEQLEEPAAALEALFYTLKLGGRILLNMPANSPEPACIYLLNEPEKTFELMKNAGFNIVEYGLFPMAGHSLEKCRKHKLTINSSAIGERPKKG